MDYAPIVERIRTEVPAFKLVDFAATFEALRERGLPTLPAAFVLPGQETARPNSLAGGVHNQVRFRIRVYLFVKFAGDALGGKVQDYLEALRAPLRDALLAWQPPGADGVIEFEAGQPEQLANGILVWRDQFAVDGYYRRVP